MKLKKIKSIVTHLSDVFFMPKCPLEGLGWGILPQTLNLSSAFYFQRSSNLFVLLVTESTVTLIYQKLDFYENDSDRNALDLF